MKPRYRRLRASMSFTRHGFWPYKLAMRHEKLRIFLPFDAMSSMRFVTWMRNLVRDALLDGALNPPLHEASREELKA